jgi:hypothetical protein
MTAAPTPPPDPDAVSNAWNIHSALADWTGKVDSKASFALGLETALFAGLIALTGPGWRLDTLNGLGSQITFWTAAVLLVVAILLSAWVVIPSLRGRKMDNEAPNYFVFFGHLKSWKEADVVDALEHRPILPVLAHSLVIMSDIAWKKHRRVQLSMAAAVLGALGILLTLLIN